MLIRITLIIAIIGGLAAGVLNFVQVKEKITTTINDRDQFHKDRDQQETDKKKALKDLASTKSMLEKTNALLVATAKERDEANATAEEKTKAAEALTKTLDDTKKERDASQAELAAWKAIGIPLENIKATLASLKDVTEDRDAIAAENKVLTGRVYALDQKIKSILDPEYEVPLPPGLKGKVVAVDDRYDFVVLDIGQNQGVLEDGKLLVNRSGKLIGKVQVKSVQPDHCIANILPGWTKPGVPILEQDEVFP